MKSHEPYDDVPNLNLSPHDIRTIFMMIASYLMFIRKEKQSRQRDAEIVLLTTVQQRMLAVIEVGGGVIQLTSNEIRAVLNAMQGFANLTRQMLPPSSEREEALKPIATISEHLRRMLPGRSN